MGVVRCGGFGVCLKVQPMDFTDELDVGYKREASRMVGTTGRLILAFF